jgi:formate hydrogenlyase subunit 3/multisubunit Na+/H+ antiporter MnhD subunit
VWLPEAHPAAPSPVSALMSGVMLKTAVYGLLRVTFDLLDATPAWWGLLAVALGLFTTLYGAVFAAVQTDMKRLLAYSSIENVGIIGAAIGLAIAFDAYGMPALAGVALSAALLHCLNHSLFKSLLFLATGAVLHATHERSLGRLGGLARQMPWVAGLALIGTLSIAGLPPLNGFVSEWMLLQAFLLTPTIQQTFVNMLLPLGAAALALAAALAAYVMVKFYGVIFLGQPRESSLANATDCGRFERLGLLWLASGCVVLGVLPVPVLDLIGAVTGLLIGGPPPTYGNGLWMLAPVAEHRATYVPAVFLLGVALVVVVAAVGVRALYGRGARRSLPWDCGRPVLTPKMQDTAEGFGQPIRHIFLPFFRVTRELPSPFDTAPRYRVTVEDRIWLGVYVRILAAVRASADFVGILQRGRIAPYLMYSFATLLVLLLVML